MSQKTAAKYNNLHVAPKKTEKIKLSLMQVSQAGQRRFIQAWGDDIAARFDPDCMQVPVLSHREGHYWIVDGQHTLYALKKWNGKGWEEIHYDCIVYEGLTEKEEAHLFRELNRRRKCAAFEDFKIALTAGDEPQTQINEIVRNQKLVISKEKVPGSIYAVDALMKVYKRDGPQNLGNALALLRDAYGDAALEGHLIRGFGLLCARYNNALNRVAAIRALQSGLGGMNGLISMAQKTRLRTGGSKEESIAAAAVEVINRGLERGNKLPSWWKE